MSRRPYQDDTRKWAITTYNRTRPQYGSRLECCLAIAVVLGAHVNTVTRWVNQVHGPARATAAENVAERLRAMEDEVRRLRQENHDLSIARPSNALQ